MHRFESSVQISKLQDLVNRSKLARCRGRFVCPVILYNGKVKRSNITSCFQELENRHSKAAFLVQVWNWVWIIVWI